MYAHNLSVPAIRTALAVSDPMGLLAVGCPDDEYDIEVMDLYERLEAGESLDAFLVMEVFYQCFEEVISPSVAEEVVQLIIELT